MYYRLCRYAVADVISNFIKPMNFSDRTYICSHKHATPSLLLFVHPADLDTLVAPISNANVAILGGQTLHQPLMSQLLRRRKP